MSSEDRQEKFGEVRLERGYTRNDPLKGSDRDERPLAFSGRQVADYSPGGHDNFAGTDWTAYEVECGQWVLAVKHWSRWDTGGTTRAAYVFADRAALEDFGDEPGPDDWSPDVTDHCPEGLKIAIAEALDEDPAERL